MTAALGIAASGMIARQKELEEITNNFANSQTHGFKRGRVNSVDTTFQQIVRPGSPSSGSGELMPSGMQRPGGVKVTSTYHINEQGGAEQTGNPLHVMIRGVGLLHVSKKDGTSVYTRDGSLGLAPDGTIVTGQGFTVMPGIKVPAGYQPNINPNGQVSIKVEGQISEKVLGTIELIRFNNEGGLMAAGDNFLKETDGSGSPQIGIPGIDGFGTLVAGHLELSNVDPIQEVVSLIQTQRSYEMCSKAVQAADDMMATTVNVA